MPNTLHGAYAPTTWVDGATMGNQTRLNNLEKQSATALASFNPDLIGAGFVLSGVAASRHNSYASSVLADSPVRYYRLGDASGSVAADLGSADISLAYTGSPTLGASSMLTGDADTSVFFASASSQYAAGISAQALPTGAGAVTLECWMNFSVNPASNQFIVSVGDRGTASHVLALILTSTGNAQLSNVTTAITSVAALSTSTRHHLVGTYDGTNLRLYVDNILVAGPTAATNALSYTGNAITIGGQSGATPGAYYDGHIDEAAVYASALSATRVTAHWTAGSTATTTVDVGSGTAYLLQSADGTVARCDVVSSTQTTVTISSTYHLYLQPDGTWYWNTANSPAANSLAIANVATDSSGNAVSVTDLRPLNVTLLPNLAGHIQGSSVLPQQIGATPVGGVTITTTSDQTLLSLTAPATGFYRGSLYFLYRNATPQLVTASFRWIDPSLGLAGLANPMIISSSATGTILNGSQALNTGNNQPVACMPVVFKASAGNVITFHFQDPGGTPQDVVDVLIERLT